MPGTPVPFVDALPYFASLQQIEATGLCSQRMLRDAIARGELYAVRLGVRRPGTLRDTRPIRVPREALLDWLTPVTGAAR